jgi:tetratricopeptide (TPR) repeat protein
VQPDNYETLLALAALDQYQGRFNQARALAQKLSKTEAQSTLGLFALAEVERWQGNYPAAQRHLEKLVLVANDLSLELSYFRPSTLLGVLYLQTKASAKAQPLLAESLTSDRKRLAQNNQDTQALLDTAAVYAAQGHPSQALAQLTRLETVGFADYRLLQYDPLFQPLRINRQFQDLVARGQQRLATLRHRVETDSP